MKILVVGGAGYIGSHMVKLLLDRGYAPTVLDDLSTGHREAAPGGDFIVGSILDSAVLDEVFRRHDFDAVMHFASFIQVGESVIEPAKYYSNNVAGTLSLLQAMLRHGVRRLVFSSSAAVYGDPQHLPLDEAHPILPRNPYGWSKAMAEQMLRDFDRAYDLRSVSLRYFNAAGADPGGTIGENHSPETHLIPLVLQAASGRRASVAMLGTDYATRDGTCVRDYIHVCDLCEAHLRALEYLADQGRTAAYNLGNGNGFSVREVIDVVRSVTGCPLVVEVGPRREGDPASLVADATRARLELGWSPNFTQLRTIVEHAWRWEQKLARASS